MTTDIIEREAKLFEAGSYPDKEIEISEEDLDKLAASTVDVPVKLEHTDTVFDGAIGMVKSAYRKGKELFGKIHLTPAAWELIKSAGAKKLSVGIKKDKSAISEVSLVRCPRVAGAMIFSGEDVIRMDDVDFVSDAEFSSQADPEIEKLKGELADNEAQSIIDSLKREGKITPAAEVFAKAILRTDDTSTITFGDSPTPVSKIFKWFLDAQPKVVEFSELATSSEQSDEPEIFTKLGVTTKQVEQYRGR